MVTPPWRAGVFSSWRTGVFSSCCLALDSSSSFPCPAFRAIAKSTCKGFIIECVQAQYYCTLPGSFLPAFNRKRRPDDLLGNSGELSSAEIYSGEDSEAFSLKKQDQGCEARLVQVPFLAAMGRRKSKRKPPPKKKMTGTLETQFTCPFCNHEKSCDVKMDRARNTGVISHTVCLEEFQTPITYLSELVDVFSDWIATCEAANQ
ncbi:hypothetical protein STEG23_038304 [Scotinomys teguina]